MTQLGDYAEDYATLNFGFTTRNVQGAGSPPFTLVNGAISVYAGSSTTQSTAGITLAADFDSVTGLNNVLIDLSSDAFYATGADYHVVITTGTVNSISVVGEVVAHFSIENRFKDVNVVQISGDASAADNLESACDNYSVTRGLTGTALPAAVADAAGGVPISDLGGLDIDATDANVTLILEDTATTIPGTITTIDNEIATIDGIVDNILIDTATTIPGTITTIDNEIATIDGIVDNILIDTGTTLDGRIPAALVGGRMDSNTSAIAGSADSAVNLDASAEQIIRATVDTGTNSHTPTTTEFQADDITEATADHFNGRIVVFRSGVLAGQATDITDYVAVGGIGQFTVTALTEAPSNNDTFVII